MGELESNPQPKLGYDPFFDPKSNLKTRYNFEIDAQRQIDDGSKTCDTSRSIHNARLTRCLHLCWTPKPSNKHIHFGLAQNQIHTTRSMENSCRERERERDPGSQILIGSPKPHCDHLWSSSLRTIQTRSQPFEAKGKEADCHKEEKRVQQLMGWMERMHEFKELNS